MDKVPRAARIDEQPLFRRRRRPRRVGKAAVVNDDKVGTEVGQVPRSPDPIARSAGGGVPVEVDYGRPARVAVIGRTVAIRKGWLSTLLGTLRTSKRSGDVEGRPYVRALSNTLWGKGPSGSDSAPSYVSSTTRRYTSLGRTCHAPRTAPSGVVRLNGNTLPGANPTSSGLEKSVPNGIRTGWR